MKVTVVDLFAGAGGFRQAAHLADTAPRISVELDEACCKTLQANEPRGDHLVLNEDVRRLTGQELRKEARLKKRDPLIVVGGPPCQPFSKASYWTDPGDDSAYRRKRANGQVAVKPKPITRPKADSRRSLLEEFARLVRESNADAFVMENVRSLLHPRNMSTFQEIVRTFEQDGFECTVVKADASNYGVPQRRQRVFVLGSRRGQPLAPAITHRSGRNDPQELPQVPSVGPVISRYRFKKYREEGEEVSGRWADALREIPPGWNYKYLTDWADHPIPLFIAETRFWNFLLKLAPDAPSWTINANPGPWVGPFHWDSRRLRTPELAAIQTFPHGYEFVGTRRERVRQIGNAVPPKMAAMMISAVKMTLDS
jgi:DNA (cytosine-5)-methyltransferase 1